MIRKMIHHIAPADKSLWHPLWEPCRNSWIERFPDYTHKLWNDQQDIDGIVQTFYPQYWKTYQSFPAHIMKIDFARFCLLHQYGGIYADMDVFCYQNFSEAIENTSGVYIVEAPYGDIPIENALMIASEKHEFFTLCMRMAFDTYNQFKKSHKITQPWDKPENREFVLNVAGPKLVFEAIKQYGVDKLFILSGELFNNHGMAYHPNFITRHLLTGIWGREAVQHLVKSKKLEPNVIPTTDYMAKVYFDDVKKYADMEGVTLENFDFFKDYTNGQFVKTSNIW